MATSPRDDCTQSLAKADQALAIFDAALYNAEQQDPSLAADHGIAQLDNIIGWLEYEIARLLIYSQQHKNVPPSQMETVVAKTAEHMFAGGPSPDDGYWIGYETKYVKSVMAKLAAQRARKAQGGTPDRSPRFLLCSRRAA